MVEGAGEGGEEGVALVKVAEGLERGGGWGLWCWGEWLV